jgi:hypothetical protein
VLEVCISKALRGGFLDWNCIDLEAGVARDLTKSPDYFRPSPEWVIWNNQRRTDSLSYPIKLLYTQA